jgi:potassium-transporting ATPase KdpC subunit
MKENIIPSIRLTLWCAAFFAGIYTLGILGIAQLAPGSGNGETAMAGGSRQHVHVAQDFTSDRYFWPRPSAVGYNAAGSGGSNKGPNNPEYLAAVRSRIDTFLLRNPGVKRADIPSDLVTASGSGIDPDISVAAARVQAARVARSRGIPGDELLALIDAHTESPLLGIAGPEKVNVLQLNMALDNKKHH